MARRTVFLPATRADARSLRGTPEDRPRTGFANTAGLRSAEADPSLAEEELDFVAQEHAGVAALSAGDDPLRLVLAVDVPADRVSEEAEDTLGAVRLHGVAWTEVRALFSDEPGAEPAVAAARSAAQGRPLAAALAEPAVAELLVRHDLLWYSPDELDALP